MKVMCDLEGEDSEGCHRCEMYFMNVSNSFISIFGVN